MAEVITMPRLSDTMTEGKVSKWHKKVGDTVKEGDVLAEIETDKAVQDFESEFNGTLLYIGTEEGSNSPVDSVLAIIGNAGEDISGLVSGGNSAPQTEEKKEEVAVSAPEVSAVSSEIPAGVEVITMPRLSDTMTEGKVAKWHKNVGDDVKEGDILAEIETDKAVQDFESEFKGTLLYQGVSEGNATNVDEILAIIGPAGTDVSAIVAGGGKVAAPVAIEAPKTESAPAVNATVSTTTSTGGRINISPLAKKMASEKGIDISTVKGSGDNGRIVKKDIENYQPSAAPVQQTAAVSTSVASAPAAQVAMNFVAGETCCAWPPPSSNRAPKASSSSMPRTTSSW